MFFFLLTFEMYNSMILFPWDRVSRERFYVARCIVVCIEAVRNDSQEVWRLSEERPRTSSWLVAFQPVMHELVIYNRQYTRRDRHGFPRTFIIHALPNFFQRVELSFCIMCKVRRCTM